jgi:glycosyltransferase involved in cell wall biosynthesis
MTVSSSASKENSDLLISLVVPVFNEEASIDVFLKHLNPVLNESNDSFQILFVDDGSRDRTCEIIEAIASEDDRIILISLSRNFGKEAALTAGLEEASGDAVIPMDVDLQDPPELILSFIEKWKQGYDVVYGKRALRREEGFLKRFSASTFYELFNCLSPMKIPMNVGDYRLMDRQVIDVLNRLPERNRFMKGLFAWAGFKSIGIDYARPERKAGDSKWNYWKLWNFALDGVLSFSTVPLRIWSYLGALFAILGLSYGAYIVMETMIHGRNVPGYASLMTAILFFGGIQLISLGIIGEYIGRIFLEVKQRPVYVKRKERQKTANRKAS